LNESTYTYPIGMFKCIYPPNTGMNFVRYELFEHTILVGGPGIIYVLKLSYKPRPGIGTFLKLSYQPISLRLIFGWREAGDTCNVFSLKIVR